MICTTFCPAFARPRAPNWLSPTPWPLPPPTKAKYGPEAVLVVHANGMSRAAAATSVARRRGRRREFSSTDLHAPQPRRSDPRLVEVIDAAGRPLDDSSSVEDDGRRHPRRQGSAGAELVDDRVGRL